MSRKSQRRSSTTSYGSRIVTGGRGHRSHENSTIDHDDFPGGCRLRRRFAVGQGGEGERRPEKEDDEKSDHQRGREKDERKARRPAAEERSSGSAGSGPAEGDAGKAGR